jgi:hypothetical protein
MEKTAGPHSTSLRAGSPLRFAPVGMTIHILVRMREPKRNRLPEKVTGSQDYGFVGVEMKTA